MGQPLGLRPASQAGLSARRDLRRLRACRPGRPAQPKGLPHAPFTSRWRPRHSSSSPPFAACRYAGQASACAGLQSRWRDSYERCGRRAKAPPQAEACPHSGKPQNGGELELCRGRHRDVNRRVGQPKGLPHKSSRRPKNSKLSSTWTGGHTLARKCEVIPAPALSPVN